MSALETDRCNSASEVIARMTVFGCNPPGTCYFTNGRSRRILAIEHAPSIGWTCPLRDLARGSRSERKALPRAAAAGAASSRRAQSSSRCRAIWRGRLHLRAMQCRADWRHRGRQVAPRHSHRPVLRLGLHLRRYGERVWAAQRDDPQAGIAILQLARVEPSPPSRPCAAPRPYGRSLPRASTACGRGRTC